MTMNRSTDGGTVLAREGVNYVGTRHNIFASGIGPQIVHEEPNEAGHADVVTPPVVVPPVVVPPVTPPTPEKPKTTDADAKLLKENMKAKKDLEDANARLAAFGDLDPAKVKELVDAAAKAENDRVAAEEAAAIARGDFDGVKKGMIAAHTAEITARDERLTASQAAYLAAQATIEELTVGTDFATSKFIKEDLVLTPRKARQVYAAHFEFEDGRTVGYTKPRGAADRGKIVDGEGNPVGFDAALKAIVEADPEKDDVLRSKSVAGAQSKTLDGKVTPPVVGAGLTGLARIRATIGNLKPSKPAA